MTVFLASPGNQMQADKLKGMDVLVSFGCCYKWVESYQLTYKTVLLDSGAFSALSGRNIVDVAEYAEWARRWGDRAIAWAGLDDIRGDWRKSLANYEHGGFPTMHDTDPIELLDDLIPMARERGGWIGIGLLPPRRGKGIWVREILDRIPDDLHVHGWALRLYWRTHRRLDSVDSTNWFRDSWKYKKAMPWLTSAECMEIVVKRYERDRRKVDLQME